MSVTGRILIVDDDAEIRTLLARYLKENGFEVSSAQDGREMRDHLANTHIDLVILDVMLPGLSGFDLCREIRSTSHIPVMMLTARGEETDRVVGLELGADDYVQKPFSPRELTARIRAVLRRANQGSAPIQNSPSSTAYNFEGWRIELGPRQVISPNGKVLELSSGEYDVLLALAEHPRQVLSRDRMLDLARHRLPGTFDRSMDVQISRLRRKLSQAGGGGLITTIRGVGYMLTAQVTRT